MHDAGYLKAAITAIQQFTEHKIRLSLISQPGALPAQTDWLFWLSMQPIPAPVKAANIWRYDSGAVVNASSWIISNTAAPIPLFKRIQAHQPVKGSYCGRMASATPCCRWNKRTIFLLTAFLAAWTPPGMSCPGTRLFPKLLLQLLYPDSTGIPADKDRQAIAAQQLRPDQYSPELLNRKTALQVTDLAPLLWAAVFVLFLVERIWVFITKRASTNG